MSQTTEAFLKVATAFLSPVSAMRLLIAAVCWALAWRYVQPVLVVWGVPEAQLQIIVLAVGVSVGSILGYGGQALLQLFRDSRTKALEMAMAMAKEARLVEDNLRQAEQFVLGFKETFSHFTHVQRTTVRLLAKRNETLDIMVDDIKALISNKYVSQVRRVSGTKHICALHPDLVAWIREEYEHEIEEHISEFLRGPGGRQSLIAAMRAPPGLLPIWEDELSDIQSYTRPIRKQRSDTEDGSFWLTVVEDYLDPLERRLAVSLSEELVVKLEMIKRGNRPVLAAINTSNTAV